MSMEQIPAKEFMRRLASIDKSLQDIAKSLGTLTKIANRQYPKVTLVRDDTTVRMSIDSDDLLEEDFDDE